VSNATWLLPVLRDVGLDVKTVSGWEGRGRPASTGGFRPRGVLIHHTGTGGTLAHPSLGLLVRGRGKPTPLAGPLTQISTARTGVVWLAAAGRANHAGVARKSGPVPAGDGNAELIGDEVETSGYQEMSTVQRESVVLSSAAILRHLGQDASWARLHAETSVTGKWDLAEHGHTINAAALRRDIADTLERLRPPKPRTSDLPKVDLSRTLHAFRVEGARKRTPKSEGTYPRGVRLVEQALADMHFLSSTYVGDGYAGPTTVEAYAEFQKALGYHGRDADGEPGMTSLVQLGHRTKRFAVVT
jgi:hypothetical protein